MTEHTDQEGIHQAIWDNVQNKRFFLAEAAPICNGDLREQFGYCADTEHATSVLDGTYQARDETDGATLDLFHEVAQVKATTGPGSIKDTITGEEWSEGWKRQKEETSLSKSGLRFGHYRSGAFSSTISHLHAMKSSVAFRKGVPLERWKSGLAVMLQKQVDCTLVDKLRSILLMEADFNFCNKLLIGKRMMAKVRETGHMA